MASSSVAISRRGRRLIAVYFAGFLAFLYVPLALMLVLSFGENFSGLPWTGFTFDWYRAAYEFDDLSGAVVDLAGAVQLGVDRAGRRDHRHDAGAAVLLRHGPRPARDRAGRRSWRSA